MEQSDKQNGEILITEDSLEQDDRTLTPGVYYPRNKVELNSKRHRHQNPERIVKKSGEINLEKTINHRQLGGIFNCYVTFVDARWRWTLLYFTLAYSGDWLFFAFIYWLIALSHGDLLEENLPPYENGTVWTPCINEIYGFTSTFLFSIEVHTTLAYGRRSITLECPHAIFTMCIQCIASSFFQAFMVGILFAKLTRPKVRTQTILFSKKAIISQIDDKLCLRFRVGDIRKSRILDVRVKAYLIRFITDTKVLEEFEQIEMKMMIDGCETLFFLWPLTVVHVIDETSPFYEISAADFLCGNLEILVVFEGIVESTGKPVQARSSYTESDILWGNRFVPMVEFDENKNVYHVDFSKFSETQQIDTPLCSASEYKRASKQMEYLTIVQNNILNFSTDKDTGNNNIVYENKVT